MQVFPQQLTGLPVISLQSGSRIATTTKLVIDPDRLAVVALVCATPATRLLLPQDIRQVAPQGVLVNFEEALSEPDDIVRIAPLYLTAFTPVGLPVFTDLNRKIGKVETYTVNSEDYLVQKLHVRRPMWQSFAGASAIIDRDQVVDVTPTRIVVKDTDVPEAAVAAAAEQVKLQI